MTRLKCISGLILVLLLSSVAIVAPSQAQADPGAAVWSRYPVPEEGESGDWVLASDGITEETGVTAICAAFDGTIYAGTEEILGSSFDGYDLFKSTDDGYTWTPLWEIPSSDKPADADIDSKIIALVLPDWECSDILYLATQYNVYKSTDGGEKFTTIGGRPAYGSGTTSDNSCLITSFDIISYLGDYLLVVSSSDADAGDYGGAYICDESTSFTSWSDLRVGGDAGTKYDVLAVAFPPDFSDEQQIVAVVTDEVDTIVATRLGISDWGADIGDAVISGLAATGGSLAFPAD